MAVILTSQCCQEGFRYQGRRWPTICPRCLRQCEWTPASVEQELRGLTPYDRLFLKINRINPERPFDVGPSEDD